MMKQATEKQLLKVQDETPQTADQVETLYTIDDLTRRLKFGKSTVWRKVKLGQLPAPIKIGGSTRWRPASIKAIISGE